MGQSSLRAAIIGAGMAGLACAARLAEAGLAVTVLEKSRGIGGRLATRRTADGLTFDHGAQYVTAKGVAFAAYLEAAQAAGAAASWRPRGSDEAGGDWIVGAPGMKALAAPLAAGLDIRFETSVREVAPAQGGWRLTSAGEPGDGVYDAVVIAVPAPQAAPLAAAAPELSAHLARVEIAPCWALMLAFEEARAAPFDVWRGREGPIAWLARNAGKPGRAPTLETWVAHASPDWSAEHLELEKDEAAARLTPLVLERLGDPAAQPALAVAHRWRYALTTQPAGAPYLADASGSLFVAGDWLLGARVEYAYDSGRAAAEALISAFSD